MLSTHALAQPQASDVVLGDVSHNQPDNTDMGVSYTLSGADAERTAVAWYRNASPLIRLYMVFEGGSSNALLDLSGNSDTVTTAGVVSAATAWDATGGINGSGAFLFGAGANRFYLNAGNLLNTTGYTKACWLKATNTNTSRNVMSGSTWPTGGHVMFASGSVGSKISAGHNGVTTVVQDNVNGALVLGQWYHYAVTYDGTTGQMILYANGVAVDTGTAGAVTDSSVLIGSLTSGAGNEWPGYLDDVRIYDYPLSSEQVAALYNGSDTIRATETTAGEDWYAEITPFSSSAMGSAIQSNTLTIATDPPIVGDIPDEQVLEDAAFSSTNLDNYVTDANHADNLISWTYFGNSLLSVSIASGQATISAPADWFGSEVITFRATDPDGNYNEDAATFSATSVNDTPTVVNPIADVAATDADSPIDNYADLNTVFTDIEDAGNLSFAVASNSNPSVVNVTIDVSDQLDLAFFSGQSGIATIIVSATDNDAASVEDTFLVDVAASNTPPVVISPIADVAVDEDSPDINSYVDLNVVFNDAEDGDNLAFQILSNTNPSLVTVAIGASDSAIDLSFTADASGSATITVRATDSQSEFVDDTFDIVVAGINDPPVLSAIGPQTTDEGVEVSFAIQAGDIDSPGIMLSGDLLPIGAMVSDNGDGSGVFSWTPSFSDQGSVAVSIIAEDSDSLAADTEVVSITVVDVPNLSTPSLFSSSPGQLETDSLFCNYSLIPNADKAAVAWYRNGSPTMSLYMVFEGGANNGLLDLSGNSHAVTAAGQVPVATAWDASGGQDGNGAYLFSSTSGNQFYLDAGTVMNTSAYTKALWLKRVKLSGSSHNILSSTTTTGYHVLYSGGSAGNRVTAFHLGQAVKVADPDTLVDGVWYHYAVTYQASDGTMIMYRNGVQVASGTAPAFTDQTLMVGSFTGAVNNQWEGFLDDVRIYNHVLSPEQIAALYQLGSPAAASTIVPEETERGDVWAARVTPFSDVRVGPDSMTADLEVYYINQPPVVSSLSPQSVDEGLPLSLSISATDPDLDNLTFSVLDLPTGAVFTDNQDGSASFEWTPGFLDQGVHVVSFVAADDSLASDTESVQITVIDDATVPTLVLVSPADYDTSLTASKTLEFTVNDNSPLRIQVYGDTLPNPERLVYVADSAASGTIQYEWTDNVLPPDDPSTLGLWHCESLLGGTLVDSGPLGNNGGASGNTHLADQGHLGYCVSFDGVSDYVAVADAPELDLGSTDELTIEAWVHPVTGLGGFTEGIVVKQAAGPSPSANYGLVTVETFGTDRVAFRANSQDYVAPLDLPQDEWSHVAVTVSPDSGAVFYLNGSRIARIAAALPGSPNNDPLLIGSAGDSSTSFGGAIDEVRMLNRALSAEEIAENLRLAAGTYHWRVEVSDLSGNSSQSPSRQLTILPQVAPMAIFPPSTSDSILYELQPEFVWSSWRKTQPGLIRYYLEVSDAADFATASAVIVVDTTYTWAVSLTPGDQYWWRVTAFDEVDTVMSDNVLSFYPFVHGDLSHNHQIDISDIVALVNFMFKQGDEANPWFLADLNGDCGNDIADLVYLVNYMFRSGPDPLLCPTVK
jgi:hypothetical protein